MRGFAIERANRCDRRRPLSLAVAGMCGNVRRSYRANRAALSSNTGHASPFGQALSVLQSISGIASILTIVPAPGLFLIQRDGSTGVAYHRRLSRHRANVGGLDDPISTSVPGRARGVMLRTYDTATGQQVGVIHAHPYGISGSSRSSRPKPARGSRTERRFRISHAGAMLACTTGTCRSCSSNSTTLSVCQAPPWM